VVMLNKIQLCLSVLLRHIILVCDQPHNTCERKYRAVMHENFPILPQVTGLYRILSYHPLIYMGVDLMSPNDATSEC